MVGKRGWRDTEFAADFADDHAFGMRRKQQPHDAQPRLGTHGGEHIGEAGDLCFHISIILEIQNRSIGRRLTAVSRFVRRPRSFGDRLDQGLARARLTIYKRISRQTESGRTSWRNSSSDFSRAWYSLSAMFAGAFPLRASSNCRRSCEGTSSPPRSKGDLYDLDKPLDARKRALEIFFQNRPQFAAEVDAEFVHPFLNALYLKRMIREARMAEPHVWRTAVMPIRAPRCLGSAAIVSIVSAAVLNSRS